MAETPRNSSKNRGKGLVAKGFKTFTNRQKQNKLLWILVCILFGEHMKFAKTICSQIINNMFFIFWSVTRFFHITYSAKTPLYLHSMEWSALHLLLPQPAGRGVEPGLVLESFTCLPAFFRGFDPLLCHTIRDERVAENIPVLSGCLVFAWNSKHF